MKFNIKYLSKGWDEEEAIYKNMEGLECIKFCQKYFDETRNALCISQELETSIENIEEEMKNEDSSKIIEELFKEKNTKTVYVPKGFLNRYFDKGFFVVKSYRTFELAPSISTLEFYKIVTSDLEKLIAEEEAEEKLKAEKKAEQRKKEKLEEIERVQNEKRFSIYFFGENRAIDWEIEGLEAINFSKENCSEVKSKVNICIDPKFEFSLKQVEDSDLLKRVFKDKSEIKIEVPNNSLNRYVNSIFKAKGDKVAFEDSAENIETIFNGLKEIIVKKEGEIGYHDESYYGNFKEIDYPKDEFISMLGIEESSIPEYRNTIEEDTEEEDCIYSIQQAFAVALKNIMKEHDKDEDDYDEDDYEEDYYRPKNIMVMSVGAKSPTNNIMYLIADNSEEYDRYYDLVCVRYCDNNYAIPVPVLARYAGIGTERIFELFGKIPYGSREYIDFV